MAKANHPDIGGDSEIMKQINSEYDIAISKLRDTTSTKKSDSQTQEAEFYKDIISKLIIHEDIEVEICGLFIWISGNTKPIKDKIKDLGFRWARKKCQWYYKPAWYYSKNKSEWTMDDIRSKYGSTSVKNESEKIKKIS